jgi:hypothetical protein
VTAQLLSAPRPPDVLSTVRDLWAVQIDPTSTVARTEHLVLFSRLGSRYRPADLERLLWRDRSLFEYDAFIVPTTDYPIHREVMRRYPPPTGAARHEYVRRYLRANASFRRYILRRLREGGPLRTRDFEDRSAEGWRTGGWNDDQPSTGQMLETLWARGEVMIVGRDGQQRIWDLAERRLPVDAPRPSAREFARTVVERQLRAHGVAKPTRIGRLFDGTRPSGWERAFAELERDGIAVRAEVEGLRGTRWVHAPALDRPFRPRAVALSPFDRLIHDRDRAQELFGFHYRVEIYVPPAKRRYGYFVLPILHGDRLIGRFDPRFDRESGTLRVDGIWAEPAASVADGRAAARAVRELAAWVRARAVALPNALPSRWRRAFAAL